MADVKPEGAPFRTVSRLTSRSPSAVADGMSVFATFDGPGSNSPDSRNDAGDSFSIGPGNEARPCARGSAGGCVNVEPWTIVPAGICVAPTTALFGGVASV